MRRCHVAVLIVGKRYGTVGADALSITHNEFRTAKEQGKPVITLVDHEVLTNKRTYDINVQGGAPVNTFPGMEAHASTFAFLQEIVDSPVNNGILGFDDVDSAIYHLKRQLAHLFGDLLDGVFKPERTELKDVLSELKGLRAFVEGSVSKADATRLVRGVRFLLEDERSSLYSLVNALTENIEEGVPDLIIANDIEQFIERRTGHRPEVIDVGREQMRELHDRVLQEQRGNYRLISEWVIRGRGPDVQIGILIVTQERRVQSNSQGLEDLNRTLGRLKRYVESGDSRELGRQSRFRI